MAMSFMAHADGMASSQTLGEEGTHPTFTPKAQIRIG